MRTEKDIFEDLHRLTSSSGYIYALPSLCLESNLFIYDLEHNQHNDFFNDKLNRIEISTLIGLMIKADIDFSIPSPERLMEYIQQSKALLQELHENINKNAGEVFIKQLCNDFELNNINNSTFKNYIVTNSDMIREMIAYSADSAYDFQYLDFFYERYRNDSDWLVKKYGFDINDLRLVVKTVNENISKVIKSNSDTFFIKLFSFDINELVIATGITYERLIRILELFTSKPNSNKEFNNISDFNIVKIKPFIKKDENTYILFQYYNFLESLYESPFYWFMQDKDYKNIATKHRGDFAENFVYNTLIKVFGQENVYKNIEIYDSKKRLGEIDVLVVFENRAIIIQIKSKRLTEESKKGNAKIIDDDFKKAVQTAYNQGYRCACYMQNKKYQIKNSQKNLNFEHVDFKEIYIFCIVSDHYPALTMQSYNFIKYTETDIIKAPFIMDIFLLDVLSEMLDNPLYFLSYINKRTMYFKNVLIQSELTLLSYHLKYNLHINSQYQSLVLNEDIVVDLDLAMLSRRRNAKVFKAPDGILTRHKDTIIGDFIEQIKYNKNKYSIELGLFLLTLSEDTIKQINKYIQEKALLFKKDNKLHDITMFFDECSTGLTIHIGNKQYDEAYIRLLEHCKYRKYRQSADNWFGLYFNPIRENFEFVIMSNEKWIYSREQGEKVVSNLLNRNIKIGRNDKCPCGSGKKYKKCCINKNL